MRIEKITAEKTAELRQEVLRPGCPMSEVLWAGDASPEAGHFGVFEGENLVAVGSVYRERCEAEAADEGMRGSAAWRLRGMATAATCRGKGLGSGVLKACLEHARTGGARTVWCNARVAATSLYLRHGFVRMTDVYVMPGIGPHYLMKRDL